MMLSDAELSLRPRGPRDVFVLDWSGDAEAERFGEELEGSSWSQLWDRRRRQAFWVCIGDEVVGEADLFDIRRGDRTAELRIGLAPTAYLGKGYGRRALQLLLDYASGHLQLGSVYLRVREANTRAVRCYLAVGFRRHGRLRGERFPEPVLLMHRELMRERIAQGPAGELIVDSALRETATGEFSL
ncbi:MAG: GNAT family protein [Thermaerobacter sp.]|nr:GNAT family protein [Thermaerobacter sp.]